MFFGQYNGKQRHAEDIQDIIQRADSMGVVRCIATAGNVEESRKALNFVRNMPSNGGMFVTAGVHPTRCDEFKRGEDLVFNELCQIIEEGIECGHIAAVGECGLDYDRLNFCDKETQAIGFTKQFELAEKYNLPMFLHDRNTGGDFLRMIQENSGKMPKGGVVHSFTGTLQEMQEYVALGLYIGINGCSLKTEENLQIVAQIPSELLLLETDAPWCGIKNTHASKPHVKTEFPSKKKEKYERGWMVKDRSEPCNMVQVLEVVAAVRGVDPVDLANTVYDNTMNLFSLRGQS
jgi:TatD DNase family protein